MIATIIIAPFTANSFNAKNFPMKPAKSGMPKSDNMENIIMSLMNGELSSLSVAMSTLLCSLSMAEREKKIIIFATECDKIMKKAAVTAEGFAEAITAKMNPTCPKEE